jgi:hypothetical protein
MSFREEEEDFLITNAARDRAEVLLAHLRELAESADRQVENRDDLTPDQIEQGRFAMQEAIAATERMLANLNEAMAVAEQAVRAGGWKALDAEALNESRSGLGRPLEMSDGGDNGEEEPDDEDDDEFVFDDDDPDQMDDEDDDSVEDDDDDE